MKENEILEEELLDDEEVLDAPVTHDVEEAVEGTLEEDKDAVLDEISD